MKTGFTSILTLAASLFCLSASAAGGPGGPGMDEAFLKLFGGNPDFSAAIESRSEVEKGQFLVMKGKMFLSGGNARMEFALDTSAGDEETAEQLKAMGMDKMVSIARPDKKMSYLVYPSLECCVDMPDTATNADSKAGEDKIDITPEGKETAEGHPCVRNKVVITSPDGTKEESLVWNATDLKNFPVKIEQGSGNEKMTIFFRDVDFAKSDSALFEVPSSYKHYLNFQTMMQEQMMKRMNSMRGMTDDSE
jgi:hypothetical protein